MGREVRNHPRHADPVVGELLGELAGDAGAQVEEGVGQGSAVEEQRASTVRIESVSVTALSDIAATATVRATHERTRLDRASGRLIDEQVAQHVSLRLVREDGRWLVAELLVLGEQPADAQGVR